MRKTRLHFHEFMREVHRELAELQGTVNPLDELGQRIAKRYRLICFDEFHVADITDAMILHRLLDALFDNGVGFVTTSNFKPDDLYPDGLHRDRILPAIALLNEKLEVISVDNGIDYRRRTLEQVQLYHTPLGAAGRRRDERGLRPAGRERTTRTRCCTSRRAKSAPGARPAAWSGSTSRRCAAARARRTTTWKSRPSSTPCCCRDVPYMPVRMASEARRFTWLIDVLYDRRVKLIMSAEVPPEALYTEGPLAHEFPRTVSRLNEMQSAEFLALRAPDRRYPPDMKSCSSFLAPGCVPALVRRTRRTTDAAARRSARASPPSASRAEAALHAEQEKACYGKFAVNDCLDAAARQAARSDWPT